ncbi:MAG: hypothetical protein GY758_18675, partial [Fuerstiella sp.]|nr:hypothetical protein [Fuerstiella sp.]
HGSPLLLAITGVQTPNRESETVRAIVQLASSDQFDSWQDLTDGSSTADTSAVSVLTGHGMRHFRILRVCEDSEHHELARIAIEIPANGSVPDEYVLNQISSAAAGVLAKLRLQERTVFDRVTGSRRVRWLAVAAAFFFFLAVCPATFEVEVPGQIVSTNHRRIFAPENGIIEGVMFTNEQPVEADMPLLQLSNADIDLEIRRLQGEISTATAELAAVNSRRLATG